MKRIVPVVVAIGMLVTLATPAHAAGRGYLSPMALVADKDGREIYVAESTAKQVAVVDVAQNKIVRSIGLPDAPGGVALSPDSATLYVTNAAPAGKVFAVGVKTGKVRNTIAVAHTPMAPVVSPDGATLYVCNRFSASVSAIDTATNAELTRIGVAREPVAAAITPDGKLLFVANLLPTGPSDGDFIAAAVSVIDTASRNVCSTITLPNGSSSLRGICVSPDGKYAYVTHILARYQMPTTQLERGWMNTNALSVIDVAGQKLVNTVLLDDVDLGAANPWGVACTADGKYVCVAHAGTHEVSVINRDALHTKLDKVAKGEPVSEVSATAADVPNDLSFLVNVRRRLPLTGNGPRGIVVIGTKAYAAEYFTDSLGITDIRPDVRPQSTSLALSSPHPPSAVRKGEMFFNDASLCFQHWQSCASCHPDARVDGLNWDLLNDGLGNPKNTKNMLLSHKTPPVMSMGVRDKAEIAVRAGIKFIQFAVRPDADAAAIDDYLKSMKPVPSPHLIDGKLSPGAQRGKEIFGKAGCASCHPAPLCTDLKGYDLGTGTGMDAGKEFDTPTLVEVWRTAPYLHDGRAANMKDALTKFNPGDRHGTTSGLTPEELDDLVEFVLSR